MSRQRWFCSVCGGLTNRPPGPTGRAYCRAHADIPALDAVPPDPLESLPSMSQATQTAGAYPESKRGRLLEVTESDGHSFLTAATVYDPERLAVWVESRWSGATYRDITADLGEATIPTSGTEA